MDGLLFSNGNSGAGTTEYPIHGDTASSPTYHAGSSIYGSESIMGNGDSDADSSKHGDFSWSTTRTT